MFPSYRLIKHKWFIEFIGIFSEDDDKSLQDKDSKEDDKTEIENVFQSDNVESTEESTQNSEQKPQEEHNQKTKKSRDSDSDSSSDEEKDPDKLQYWWRLIYTVFFCILVYVKVHTFMTF